MADAFLFGGAIAIIVGVACIDWRAGLIVGGLLSAGVGYLVATTRGQ